MHFIKKIFIKWYERIFGEKYTIQDINDAYDRGYKAGQKEEAK